MNRKKVADAIVTIMDSGTQMLGKGKLDQNDYGKIKVIRSISSAISAGVLMIQQETAQQRNVLIAERMKQMGFGLGNGEQKQVS